MISEKVAERVVQNLLILLPNWHAKLVRPFKDTLNKEMSLETYYCLGILRMCGRATMTELARQLKVSKQQVTKLVEKLSAHHFIERVYNEQDRREIRIQLTPEAVIYLDEYYLKNRPFIRNIEQQLTAQEIERLNTAFETLKEILPKLN